MKRVELQVDGDSGGSQLFHACNLLLATSLQSSHHIIACCHPPMVVEEYLEVTVADSDSCSWFAVHALRSLHHQHRVSIGTAIVEPH